MPAPLTRIDAHRARPARLEAREAPAAGALRISVVITNYNYAAYLAEAVDSVLGQDWPHVECIVVDDGSTDGSRAIIAGYGGIVPVLQPNAGHARAAQAGFARATGDIIVFLDADDFLLPGACRAVAAQWRPGMSALLYRLQVLRGGTFEFGFLPAAPFRAGDLARRVLDDGSIPSAPTSGNAFSRAHVATVFAAGSGLDVNSIDSQLVFCAPMTGEVRCCERVLGAYRMHGANLSNFGKELPLRFVKLRAYYAFHAQRTARKLAVAKGLRVPRWDHLDGPYNLKTFLLTRDFTSPGVEIPPRSTLACVAHCVAQFWRMEELPRAKRALNAALACFFGIAPKALRRLVGARFYGIDFGAEARPS